MTTDFKPVSAAERRLVPMSNGPVQVQTREDGKRFLVGLGAVFYRSGSPGTEYHLFDNLYERVADTAFDRALSEKHDARGLFNHNPDYLLGRVANGTMTLTKTDRGLQYEIPVDDSDPDHQKVVSKVERGDLSGSSFAFQVTGVEWKSEGENEYRIIKDVTLYDTGPVTYPAYEGTSVAARGEHLVAEARSEHAMWKEELKRKAEMEATQLQVAKEQLEAAQRSAETVVTPVVETLVVEEPVVETVVTPVVGTVVEPAVEAKSAMSAMDVAAVETPGQETVPSGIPGNDVVNAESLQRNADQLALMQRMLQGKLWS